MGLEATVASLDRAQVVTVALAQRENGAVGAEGLLPEMREGRSRGFGIDGDALLLLRVGSNRANAAKNDR